MGKLFSDMASMVLEQGEVLGRIEDDVEAGLEDTKGAYDSITSTYEMTRGNRAMIIKIFALLVFFVVLFLFWF
jgi:syntaxin 5